MESLSLCTSPSSIESFDEEGILSSSLSMSSTGGNLSDCIDLLADEKIELEPVGCFQRSAKEEFHVGTVEVNTSYCTTSVTPNPLDTPCPPVTNSVLSPLLPGLATHSSCVLPAVWDMSGECLVNGGCSYFMQPCTPKDFNVIQTHVPQIKPENCFANILGNTKRIDAPTPLHGTTTEWQEEEKSELVLLEDFPCCMRFLEGPVPDVFQGGTQSKIAEPLALANCLRNYAPCSNARAAVTSNKNTFSGADHDASTIQLPSQLLKRSDMLVGEYANDQGLAASFHEQKFTNNGQRAASPGGTECVDGGNRGCATVQLVYHHFDSNSSFFSKKTKPETHCETSLLSPFRAESHRRPQPPGEGQVGLLPPGLRYRASQQECNSPQTSPYCAKKETTTDSSKSNHSQTFLCRRMPPTQLASLSIAQDLVDKDHASSDTRLHETSCFPSLQPAIKIPSEHDVLLGRGHCLNLTDGKQC